MIFEAIFFILVIAITIREIRRLRRPATTQAVTRSHKSAQLKELEARAARLYGDRQYLAAEKAYLKVLKINHTDAQAYNRLGLIYVALKNYDDATECFQISAQLKPTAAAWYNLGLAYNENGNAIKAIAAIEKAIMFEPSAVRYQGLAKAYAKVGNQSKLIWALEQAVAQERTKRTLTLLAEAYARDHQREKMQETYRQVLDLDPGDAKARRLAGDVVQPAKS